MRDNRMKHFTRQRMLNKICEHTALGLFQGLGSHLYKEGTLQSKNFIYEKSTSNFKHYITSVGNPEIKKIH